MHRMSVGKKVHILGSAFLIAASLAVRAPSRAQAATECSDWKAGWILCEDFEGSDFLSNWDIGSNGGTWPDDQFVRCNSSGFNDSCAAWSNKLVFDNYWGYYGYDARRSFPPQSELYIRWYQYVSNPYQWGSHQDDDVLVHDPTGSFLLMYLTANQVDDGGGCDGTSGGMGKPAVITYQDRDWADLGNRCTKVNRYQNQGNDITLQPGKWYLFEWYIKLNTPGVSDGLTKLWVDDASQPIRTQTLRLSYTDMRWLRSGDAGLQPGQLRLLIFNQGCNAGAACPALLDQYQKWDQIVISTAPIGPWIK
jgi:hypothetical protein